jgi:hypothetical protein
MMWSFWGQKSFDACQQQWFFKNKFAHANAKKMPLKREAFLLSTLETVYAWRGRLVDEVISNFIVPRLKTEWEINEAEILAHARQLYHRQINFAFAERFRELGMSKTKGGEDFAAFFEIEYGQEIGSDALEQAWADIELALKNFIEMPQLINKLLASRKLIAQRVIDFPIFSAKARAKPDLIGFYHFEPPYIFDWKVHTFATTDYREQLATYALALERCIKFPDLMSYRGKWLATDMKLFEVQLLKKTIREYQITEDDIDRVESKIIRTYEQMNAVISADEEPEIQFASLNPARYAETCETCEFQKICREVLCEKSKPMTSLF